MKIGIDISQIIYEGTGVGNYTSHLVTYLSKSNDIELVLFGSSFGAFNKLQNFVSNLTNSPNTKTKLYPLPERLLNLLWNNIHFGSLEHFIGNVDIFHTSDWLEPPSRAKKVTTIHDLTVYKNPDLSHPYIVSTQKNKLRWVRKESDAIITDSEATKTDIIEILKIPEEKITVIYPGVDERFKPQDKYFIQDVKKKYNIKNNYLLCVGTQEPRKNIDKVIESFKLLSEKDIELVIVGKYGWGEKSKVLNNVHTLGFIPNEDLPALYSGAKIFIYPSLDEGFGLPVLEAMASGCPVIASEKGSLKEIINNAAIIIDPTSTSDLVSSIEILLKDNIKRDELIDKGKKQSQKFNWNKTSSETLSLYTKLLE